MHDDLLVRPARADDKDAILSFCANTFSWGDYIHEVWDYWLADDRGKMFVGELAGKPVGLIRTAIQSDGAGWLEGMRVHPDYRRRGVASALDAKGRAYARERGCRLARLATHEDNLAARKTLAQQGYARVAHYGNWIASSTRGKFLPPASADAIPDARAVWRKTPCAIVADPDWHWETLGEDSISKVQRAGDLRCLPYGMAILRNLLDMDGVGLILHALTGSGDAMCRLARSARTEAKYRGYAIVQAMLSDDSKTNRALACAGFKRQGGMFIYEQEL